jgi:simple sugar transport system permease protein
MEPETPLAEGIAMKLLSIVFSADFFFSTIRVTTPILFAALAALVSDRAGAVNIGLEGIMLMSALAGVLGSAWTGSALAGLAAAVLIGVAAALVLAYFTLKLKTHVILGGIAINMLADGGTVFVLSLATHDKGTSASLPSKVLPSLSIPGIDDLPVLGRIVSGHNVLTYVAVLSVIGIYVMLKRTPLGMKIKAAGEAPQAAESVGIDVSRVRYTALALSGLFAGLGGAFLSMGYVSWFSRGMSSGRGWIALAAEAMGRGTAMGTTAAAFLFGAADALSNSLGVLKIPSELVKTVPYLATIIGISVYAVADTRAKKRKGLRA